MTQEKQPFANPAAFGLTGLGVACMALGPVVAGWVKPEPPGIITAIAWAIMLGGVAQLISGIIEFANGSILGGTAFSGYGVLWLALGLMWWMGTLGGAKLNTEVEGWVQLGYLLFSIYMTIGFAAVNTALFLILFDIDLIFLTLALPNLGIGGPGLHTLSGLFIVILALLSFWTAAGISCNAVYGKAIFPLGPPLVKKKA